MEQKPSSRAYVVYRDSLLVKREGENDNDMTVKSESENDDLEADA